MEGPGFIIINFNLKGVPDFGKPEPIQHKDSQSGRGGLGRGFLPPGSPLDPSARMKEMGNIFETLRGYQR